MTSRVWGRDKAGASTIIKYMHRHRKRGGGGGGGGGARGAKAPSLLILGGLSPHFLCLY